MAFYFEFHVNFVEKEEVFNVSNAKRDNQYPKKIIERGYFVIMAIIFGLSLLSLLSEILTGESLYCNIAVILNGTQRFPELSQCMIETFGWDLDAILRPALHTLQAKNVFEIIQILGFGSILLAWIQTLLDKETYGIPYVEIIRKGFCNFKWVLAFHLISTVICIGLSAAGASEGAFLSLIVVLMGFLYWLRLLDVLLLSASIRQKMAIGIWEEREKNYQHLYQFAKTFSKEKCNLTNDLSDAFSKFILSYATAVNVSPEPQCGKAGEESEDNNDQEKSIRSKKVNRIVTIWKTVLNSEDYSEKNGLAGQIIGRCCNNIQESFEGLYIVADSYVSYCFSSLNLLCGNSDTETETDFLFKFQNTLTNIQYHIAEASSNKENVAKVNNRINLVYSLLVWLMVYHSRIDFSFDLLQIKDLRFEEGEADSLFSLVCSIFLIDEINPEFNKWKEELELVYAIMSDQTGGRRS